MRACSACGDPIQEDRRKDARYCKKPACRARDFRRRKKAEALQNQATHHHRRQEQLIVTCSCGSRLLIQVTHLSGTHIATPEQPQPTVAPDPETVTRTVASDIRSEENTSTTTEMAAATSADIQPPKARLPAPVLAVTSVKRTVELFGVIGGYRIVPLEDALIRHRDGSVELRPNVRLSVGRLQRDGHGLSGEPGCWPEVYPDTSPTAFGLDADLAVVSWDAQARRAVAITADILGQLIGRDWKEQILRVLH